MDTSSENNISISQDTSTKLKSCPFCGSTNIKIYSKGQAIYCEDCPGGVEEYDTTPENLIKAWNKRSTEEY